MKLVSGVLAICAFLAGRSEALDDEMAINYDLINTVNEQRSAEWVAASNPRFEGLSLSDAKRLMGTFLPKDPRYRTLPAQKSSLRSSVDIPEEFDARVKWPKCAEVIGTIKDQSSCGSCWAHSVSEAFNDRKCISTAGQFQTILSAYDLGSCCTDFCYGCSGGNPASAWQWAVLNGIVSGGGYNDTTTCKPYPFPPCAHHMDSDIYEACEKRHYHFEECSNTCQGNSSYSADKISGRKAYRLDTVEDMQRDLMEHGPITVNFYVYSDFLHYKSGVYSYVTGHGIGGHAVKVIGWGVEKGTKYWLAVNSWNPTWGDKGYFKIKRGVDECGVEGGAHAGSF